MSSSGEELESSNTSVEEVVAPETAAAQEVAVASDSSSKDAVSEDQNIEEFDYDELVALYDESMRNLAEGEIVAGEVIGITSDEVIVDVGYKSEGLIPVHEFKGRDGKLTVEMGDKIDVLLERTEGLEGTVILSKEKAERMKVWSEVENSFKENRTIKGRVIDRIKGGLTVDVGIRAFLPGSLVDIKPVKNLESFKDEELDFKVISLDRRRNNVVLSRKAVLEKDLAKKKIETLQMLKEGAVMQGLVKNITDYGVFIDLGGIDGLLHITDISWGRVNHPSEHFGVGEDVEIVVLKFDPETERVSLGYKQRSEDPWTLVDKKFPLGSRVKGRVVSIVDYGAFVEIEEGVEGLIHVSEMSWTKKVVNPSKLLNIGDEVEAIVSELDMNQRRISLSLRQTERNPWEDLSVNHPVGSIVEGKIRNLTEFGAFVEITEEIDGLIHVSDMSWTKRVKHPSEVVKKGDVVQARITNIDVENQRVSVSIKEFLPNEWDDFADKFGVGDAVTGPVVNVTDFGLFINVYEGLEGLAHVSEIDVAEGSLEAEFSVGDWVAARILRVEEDDRKVGLTMRGVPQPTEDEIAELKAAQAASEAAGAAEAEDAPADDANSDTSSEESATADADEAPAVEAKTEEAPAAEANTEEANTTEEASAQEASADAVEAKAEDAPEAAADGAEEAADSTEATDDEAKSE